jgi:hypothetical protein
MQVKTILEQVALEYKRADIPGPYKFHLRAPIFMRLCQELQMENYKPVQLSLVDCDVIVDFDVTNECNGPTERFYEIITEQI